MKKKQSKKNTQNKKKKYYSEKTAFARWMFIGIFSIPKNDPGSLSQLADNIPKLNPARPNKKNNAEIAIVEEGGISAIFLVTIM